MEKEFPSPHSGILFLSANMVREYLPDQEEGVSVPSFGDSFFIVERGLKMIVYRKMSGFRPLIRGFFFYGIYSEAIME